MTRAVLLVALYGWLLGPRFIAVDVMWICVALGFCASPFLRGPAHVAGASNGPVWLLAASLSFYSVGIAGLYATGDFGYALAWSKALVYSLSAAAVVQVYKLHYRADALRRLLQDLVACGAVSAVISVVIFVNPELRWSAGEVIVGTIANSFSGQYGVRIFDLSVGGGTAYGLFNLLLAILLYSYPELFPAWLRRPLLVVFTVVIFLSSRSVFAISLLIAAVAAKRRFGIARTLVFTLLAAALLIPAGLHLWSAISQGSWTDGAPDSAGILENTVPWALELLFRFAEGEGLRSTTTDTIADELFFPHTVGGIVFGVGDSEPPSDSGLVRTVFAVGVVGLLLHLSVVLLFLRHFVSRVLDGRARRFILSAALLLLAFNFKELIFSNSRGLFGVFVVVFYAFLVLLPTPLRRAS